MKPFDVYPLQNITPVKAHGCTVWDEKGNAYLDFYGGHAVISIGHSHPHYVKTITNQLEKIGFYSNSVNIPVQNELAQLLGEVSGYPDYQLFLCNSGAEANENALKLASFFTNKKKFIVMKNGFHGRTSAAVAATDDKSIQAPVNTSENFIFIELNNENQLIKAFQENEIAGVLLEGIQGIGGIHLPAHSFIDKINDLCKTYNSLLIVDEIQCGYGRTGKFFAHQHFNCTPHLITVAKGMGNGFPIAGVLIHPEIPPVSKQLGTTFGGNHLACAAAKAVLETIVQENLIVEAEKKGNYLIHALKQLPLVKEVRGKGLMIGLSLSVDAKKANHYLLNNHNIFTGLSADPNTLRLLPPLTISIDEINYFLNALENTLKQFEFTSLPNELAVL